ncbi:hypothetical protein FC19_GL000564 [Liquorilactobacillus aquaticus DSM 21051]|uniref:Uncharacterized protein n=1 Tax=Liquorilactobacillus aquaticus DSM 21051 TaxID=1423725 RepID=A0A0R2D6Y8_9LACO|nr:KxYKxGKxW signal peptide domain-containing protein [Liquorilactobacillus aquaticus]KRM96283.1 hypothetical protein FC19_GL000564 [Liquorilactobacillus aquaticus DSM 21051]
MQNSKKYKLYKSGKLWVVGAVAVAGVAMSVNATHVSADKFQRLMPLKMNDKQV